MKSNNERINEEIDELKRMGFIVSWFDRLKLNKLLITNTINNIIMPLREMWAEPKIKLQYAREKKKQQKYFYAVDFFLSKTYNIDDMAVKKNYRISKVLKVYEQQRKLETKLYKGIIEFERKLKINLQKFFESKIGKNFSIGELIEYLLSISKTRRSVEEIDYLKDSLNYINSDTKKSKNISNLYFSNLRSLITIILYSSETIEEKHKFVNSINKKWILLSSKSISEERKKIIKLLSSTNLLRNTIFHAETFQDFLNEERLKKFYFRDISEKNLWFANYLKKDENIKLKKKFKYLYDVEVKSDVKISNILYFINDLLKLLLQKRF